MTCILLLFPFPRTYGSHALGNFEMKQLPCRSIYNPVPLAYVFLSFHNSVFQCFVFTWMVFFFKTMRKPLSSVLTVGLPYYLPPPTVALTFYFNISYLFLLSPPGYCSIFTLLRFIHHYLLLFLQFITRFP